MASPAPSGHDLGMADWHFEDLSKAVINRGWKIEPEAHDLDFEERENGIWRLGRGQEEHVLEFSLFGGSGETLPLEDSYSCSVRGHPEISLYFSRQGSPNWKRDLAIFVRSLDGLSSQ